MRKLVLATALGALASLSLAACGGGGGSSSTTAATSTTPAAGGGGGGKATTVAVSSPAGSALAFDQKSLTAKPGSVTFNYTNPQAIGHNFCIKDSSGQQVGCTGVIAQSSGNADVSLKAGSYTFYCSVDGHEAAGMKGTLTVQ